MAPGTYSFSLQVTDGVAATTTKAFTGRWLQVSINYYELPDCANRLVYNTAWSQPYWCWVGAGATRRGRWFRERCLRGWR